MGLSKKFGTMLGKMAAPVPIVSDAVQAIGEMGEDIPVRPVADYHRGLKEGASGETEADRARRAEEREQEAEQWERRAAAVDAERLENARRRAGR